MTPSSLVVGNAVIPSSGGMPKTMRLFTRALDAELFSLTSPRVGEQERAGFPEVTHVTTVRNRLLDWYAYAGPRSRRPLEAAAERANHLSCHVMLRYHAVWAWRTARRRGIPYWIVPHGQLDPYVFTYRGGVKRAWMRLYGRRILRAAAHVIFATEREREKAEWCHDGANATVVHWPVELIPVEGRDEARSGVRDRLGIPDDGLVLLYLGRLQRMKRPIETIRALAASGSERLHLVLAGPEEDVSIRDCREAAAAAGVGARVHPIGPVFGEEKQRLLLAADGYVSLSHRENFGHTAAESLAAGRPVILSPGNDLSPELASRDCGWFLRTDDPGEAASALRAFASAPDLERDQRGLAGRAFVAETCSFEGFRDTLRGLRDEALERRADGND